MALRDQPYLPLYVDDFISDEKLRLCSAEAHGVYILILLNMHKMDEYGVIKLSRRDKKSDSQIKNFASLLLALLPFDFDVIESSLDELVDRGVLTIEGDTLYQKRMRKDGKLSETRALAGSKGGKGQAKRKQNESKSSSKSKAKNEQNPVVVIVNDNEDIDIDNSSTTEESNSARARDLSKVMTLYLDRINAEPSMSCIEMLKSYTEDMGGDVVCRAIEIAIDEKATSWAYIKAILQNWTRQKVKSIDDVDKLEAERKKAKADGSKKKYVTAAEAQNAKKPPTPQDVEQMKKFLEKLKEE